MESPMTAADVGAVLNGRGYDGNNMGGMGWIFGLIVLLAILGGGNGFGWGGNRGGGDMLTTAESCNMNSFNELKSQVGRMNDMMFANARQQDNAICNLGYTAAQQFNDTQRQISECCCDLKSAIAAEGNATRAMIQQDKIEALQAKVANLEMDQRFCGVPRLPLSFTYGVNPSSLFGGNGCCRNSCASF